MPHAYLSRELPEILLPAVELALDLRWSASRDADRLWPLIDAEVWERTANAWVVLQNAPLHHLEALARDTQFLQALGWSVESHRHHLEQATWWADRQPVSAIRGIAYFSMEFGLSEALPIYSGGLGILAGDYLKSASDLGIPAVGVGLLYQEGYFRQVLDAGGHQTEAYPYNDPASLPVQPVTDGEGWLRVSLEFPGRPVHLRVWSALAGNVPLYLLDSNDPLNSPADRGLTGKLYGGNQETRIQQELILGVGGWRALQAMQTAANVCHLNEGHAAFLTLERARTFMMQNNLTFWEALWATRPGNVFTTHTPVEAGFDRFEPDLARRYLRALLDEMGERAPGMEDVLALGRKTGADTRESLNMAYLAMRACGSANAVSKLHGSVSRALFRGLYARWPDAEIPVTSVTNGVHIPSWVSEGAEPWEAGQGIGQVSDEALSETRNNARRKLVEYARKRLVLQLGQRGSSNNEVEAARGVLDPNILTLGFARRFAEYKRPNLLLRDPERMARILSDGNRPVQILIAGKAHPADEQGKQMIANWIQWIRDSGMRQRAVFIEDYDIELAQNLAAGVDLWINTPRRPWEASGTSGMKLLANGGLNLSELDGWWAEAFTAEVGWALGDGREHSGTEQDETEAMQLYELLESAIVPEFYERDEHGIARRWLKRVRASVQQLSAQFSSDRMCREYVERLYVPAASAFERRAAQGGSMAQDLVRWQEEIERHWNSVRFGEMEISRDDDRWLFRVQVDLGGLAAESVRVELFADHSGEAMHPDSMPGWFRGVAEGGRNPGDFTPRVFPYHAEAIIPAEESRVLWRS